MVSGPTFASADPLDGVAAALGSAGVAVWRWDPVRATGLVTGAELSHPTGVTLGAEAFLACIEPGDRSALLMALTDGADGRPIDLRFRLCTGAAPRWMRVRGGRDPSGSVVAVCTDVTDEVAGRALEQRRRRSTLCQHEALQRVVRRIVEGSAVEDVLASVCKDLGETFEIDRVSVWLLDADGGLLRCMTLAERAGGTMASALTLAASATSLYLETLRQDGTVAAADVGAHPAIAEHAAYFEVHGITSVLHAACRRDGRLLGVLCHEQRGARAWTSDERGFAGSVGDALALALAIHDRTDGEAMRAELEQTLRQAEKMESLGLLAGGVAHDLNNLLTPILMGSDMVKSALGRDSAHADLIQSIVSAAIDARELVGQLLAFSRKQVLQLRELDLAEEVNRALKLLRHALPAHLEIELCLAPGLVVRADTTQLQQVLFNLAINARDAMPVGGVLRFSTFPVEVADAPMVGIAVEDTGTGIDAESLPHIFEPFFTTKGPGRGTGLGLSTVYGIVEQHGGSVQVDTVFGRGTRFEIRLPVAVTQVVRASRPRRPSTSPGNRTILVVEDEPAVRRLVVRLLSREGYQILDAGSPAEALDMIAAHAGEVHLLLTDVVMPGMNGRRLYETVITTRPDTRVVYMSGYDRDVLAPQGLLSDDVRLLPKPFTAADLLRNIRDALTTTVT